MILVLGPVTPSTSRSSCKTASVSHSQVRIAAVICCPKNPPFQAVELGQSSIIDTAASGRLSYVQSFPRSYNPVSSSNRLQYFRQNACEMGSSHTYGCRVLFAKIVLAVCKWRDDGKVGESGKEMQAKE